MKATMLLCDHAQVANEKLYVLGGGWTQVAFPDTPIPMALAVLIEVPWTSANEPHELQVELVDQDGDLVTFQDTPVKVVGQFEVGRPTGIKPGTDLTQQLVFKFDGIALPMGGYVFEFSVDGKPLARTPFRVGQG